MHRRIEEWKNVRLGEGDDNQEVGYKFGPGLSSRPPGLGDMHMHRIMHSTI